MIHGIEIKQLVRHADERGYLMEILREDDEIFRHFGQTYISLNFPEVVRAWHYHQLQTDYFVCVKGMIKVAMYDARVDSPTCGAVEEYFLGDARPIVLTIPPGVMHGYKTIGVEPSLLLNLPTHTYNRAEPDEFRLPWNTDKIPYDWAIKMG